MAKLQNTCPVCNKLAKEVNHQILPAPLNFVIIKLECGHSYTEKLAEKKNWELIEAKFGKKDKLYPFQGVGYEFARASNFRCLIGDEPGLGKTWQALTCILLHPEELTPTLITVKSALKLQWLKQVLRLLGIEYQAQIISSSTDRPNPLFSICIVTYDILWRINKKQIEAAEKAEKAIREKLGLDSFGILPEEEEKNIPSIINPFASYGFKCVILDEVQQIKNQQSKRAQQVRKICESVPHVLALSGSPIENNAGEYFTILNILRPEIFHTYKHYVENYCDWYWNGRAYKIGGIADIDHFRDLTKDFIIRRKKQEVLPDLPEKDRQFVSCEFASKKIEQEYAALQEDFEDFYFENEGSKDFMTNILAKMALMRHKTGINKVPFAADFITEWLLDTEHSRKLVVFTHHQDVCQMLAALLAKKFKELEAEGITINAPLTYTSDLNSKQRDDLVTQFQNEDNSRVMIASLLAAGEGLDGLQRVAEDCIILEREWNPKKEEQAEDRLARIGSTASGNAEENKVKRHVTCNYILTAGTIDEYFTELVEQKRAAVDQTLDGVEYAWDETSLMKELAAIIAKKGGKKWRLT